MSTKPSMHLSQYPEPRAGVLDCGSPLSSLPAKTWTRQFFHLVKCCLMFLGAAGVWCMKANPDCGGPPWRVPFTAHTSFDSFPVHQGVQDEQAPAHQVRTWMTVGSASPEPCQHRHQQIGLEERQRGRDFVGLGWHGGSSGRRDGAGVFRPGLFFWNVSKMASSSGR
jgi:hypothetical protein